MQKSKNNLYSVLTQIQRSKTSCLQGIWKNKSNQATGCRVSGLQGRHDCLRAIYTYRYKTDPDASAGHIKSFRGRFLRCNLAIPEVKDEITSRETCLWLYDVLPLCCRAYVERMLEFSRYRLYRASWTWQC